MIRSTTRRRVARDLARLATLCSAGMLVFGLAVATEGGRPAAAAAINGGSLQILVPSGSPTAGQPLNSGGSATVFAMTPPVGAACSGDTTTDGYKVQSYMVPSTVSPSTLTFDSNGPIPTATGANYRQPMFSSGGTPVINRNTAVTTGLLTGLPTMSFSLFGASGPTIVPPGTYNLGFACTLGAAGDTQLDKYWNVQLTFATDNNDSPSKITWAVVGGQSSTTTSTTIAPTSTTTTTVGGGSTTTSTTVAGGSTTTSSTVAGATTTTALGSGAGVTTTIRSSGGGQLAATGGSPLPIVFWAVLLLVFGRMAILLGRPLRVLPHTTR